MIFVVAVVLVISSLTVFYSSEEVEAASKIYLEQTLITMNIGETKQLSIKYDDSVRIKSVVYRLNKDASDKVKGKISIDPEVYEEGNIYEVPALKKMLNNKKIDLVTAESDDYTFTKLRPAMPVPEPLKCISDLEHMTSG